MSVCAELGAFAVVCLCCLRALNRASDLPGKMPPNSSAVPSPCKYIVSVCLMMKCALRSWARQGNHGASFAIKAILSAVWDLRLLRDSENKVSAAEKCLLLTSRPIPTFALLLSAVFLDSLSLTPPLLPYWLVSPRSSLWPGVMALSGRCLASPRGPQRQMACQEVVTEVDCLPRHQHQRHRSHLSN